MPVLKKKSSDSTAEELTQQVKEMSINASTSKEDQEDSDTDNNNGRAEESEEEECLQSIAKLSLAEPAAEEGHYVAKGPIKEKVSRARNQPYSRPDAGLDGFNDLDRKESRFVPVQQPIQTGQFIDNIEGEELEEFLDPSGIPGKYTITMSLLI